MWHQSGSTLWLLATLVDDVISGRTEAKKVSSEVRAIMDTHLLSPTALLQLGWKIVVEEQTQPTSIMPIKIGRAHV